MDGEDVANCVGRHNLAKDRRHHWRDDLTVYVRGKVVMDISQPRGIELVANRDRQADLETFTRGYVQGFVALWLFLQRFVDVAGGHRVGACVIYRQSFKRGHQVYTGIEGLGLGARDLTHANSGMTGRNDVVD